jgi:hypothetical protein
MKTLATILLITVPGVMFWVAVHPPVQPQWNWYYTYVIAAAQAAISVWAIKELWTD